MLTADSEGSFRKIMVDAESGVFGRDIREALIEIKGEAVQVTIFSRSGHDLVATLGRPTEGATRGVPRFFSLDATGPDDARRRLVSELDRYFVTTPWVQPMDLTEPHAPSAVTSAALSLGRPALARVSLGTTMGTLAFLVVALLASLVALWRLEPDDR